jgi:uncharacterized damage-inducible protein DinB
MEEQILDTWRIHCRITLYVLDAVADEALEAKRGKGRGVGDQFAHIHNVRLLWLKYAVPDLLAGLEKLEKDAAGNRALLRSSLEASGPAIEEMLRGALAAGRLKGFKPHPVAFLGYIISHEAYHQGDIGVALSEIGHPLDKKTAFGMWEWGVR